MQELNKLLQQKRTLIMGILNVTPDSFSDGGQFATLETAVAHAKQMMQDGADIIDIGGESTRPGSTAISVEEELKRVLPVIKQLKKELPDVPLSIDTYKSAVAKVALENGVSIVNSLGGFDRDLNLAKITSQFSCPVIIYHIKGVPETMQKGEIVYEDIISELNDFFTKQIQTGMENGMKREQFILDPGIGFGKTVEQNLEIIRQFASFKSFKLSLLIGVSRKSHLGKLLQEKLKLPTPPSPTERLEASLAETGVAVQNGAKIVRTHDVLQTKKFLTVLDMLNS